MDASFKKVEHCLLYSGQYQYNFPVTTGTLVAALVKKKTLQFNILRYRDIL